MHVSFHEGYRVDLPPTHPYPMGKYLLLRDVLADRGLIGPLRLVAPDEVSIALLERVHTQAYLTQLQSDTLDPAQRRRLGIPFTPRLWRRSRLTVEGTRLAAVAALAEGLAANMAGGTHHAFAGHGEGFCVINDVAVSVADLIAERLIRRALIVDLDVHQGNGNAAIFADQREIYTLSLHGERNYPLVKPPSTHDVGLPDGTDDAQYLSALEPALATALQHQPDLAFYIAGVDVAAGDRYGRLALTDAGVRARDRHVIDTLRNAGIPVVIVLGGGYAATTLRTAELHAIVFEEALRRWRQDRQENGSR